MFRNYIKIAWRNLLKNKRSGLITIGGLAIGLTACMLILFYVAHEHSYDRFHKDASRIYKVEAQVTMGGDTLFMSAMNASVASSVTSSSPAVTSGLRLRSEYKPVLLKNTQNPGVQFSEPSFSYADANFFNFFSFKLKTGAEATVLEKPYSVVLTEAMAQKYFGAENPLGKTLSVKKDSTYLFTVTGVMENIPSNSSIHPDFIASINSLRTMSEYSLDFDKELFRLGSFPTFLKLSDSKAVVAVEHTMQELSLQANTEATDVYKLSPLTETHLKGRDSSTPKYINIFPLIALLILILAVVNYLSLSTARATLRAKEIGVRKVNGASRAGVAVQFYVESTLYVLLAFIASIVLGIVLKPWFFQMLGIQIDSSFFLNPSFLMMLGAILVFTIVVSGCYPALVMSAFNPVENIRNSRTSKMGGERLRKLCTTVQFIIAIALLISGVIIHQQLDYVRALDTGLNRSDLVMLPLQQTMGGNSIPFRNEIEALPEVTHTAVARYPMYGGYNMFFASTSLLPDGTGIPVFSVDEDYFNTLGVQWEQEPEDQRFFTKQDQVVINEAAIKKFQLGANPVGEHMTVGNSEIEIIGVVKDFHFQSLDNPIDALALFVTEKTNATSNILGKGGGCLYVRFQPNTPVQPLLEKLETIYQNYDAESPFEYQFLDDAFEAMFRSEERLSKVFSVFIVLAMLIAGMGLFALATFSAQQRIKEIGVRKVLGASTLQLTALLSVDFIKLVILAIVIAAPIAWYGMHQWLQDFSYKTPIHWWVFIVAGLGVVVFAISTVSYQALKAAISNPIKSLRSE